MLVHLYWRGWGDQPVSWTRNYLTHTQAKSAEVLEWTDEKLPTQIKQLADDAAHLVQDDYRPRHRANIIRWWLLQEYGGCWLDYDVIPLRPLEVLPTPWVASVHRQPCSCAARFEPGHEVPAMMLDHVARLIAEPPAKPLTSMAASGDHVLMNVITPDVQRVELFVDGAGFPLNPSSPLLHLWASSSKR